MERTSTATERLQAANRVVADPLRFKARLEIGEAAYTTLVIKNKAGEAWSVAGASVVGAVAASSGVVANMFFGAAGFLGLFTVAATPLGWIIAAGVAAGGSCLGVIRLMKGLDGELVEVVPKFINTPLDVLAVGFFDLIAPLALKVAAADGQISAEERDIARSYFVEEWGYEEGYVDPALELFEKDLEKFTLKQLTASLRDFTRESRDCNHRKVRAKIVDLLKEIAMADGDIHEMEELAIQHVADCLPKDPWLRLPRFRN